MQALQDHLGVVGNEEEEEQGGEEDDEDVDDKQIWQVDFCEEGLMKVHFEHVQAIDLRGEIRVFLGFPW